MDPIWAKYLTDYINIIEDKEDKSSMCGKLIPNKERFSWDSLKLALEIHEPTRSNKSLKLSWDNHKNGGKIIMSRLDWIYIPIYLTSNQASNNSHYFVKGDGIKSNHHLVSCVLEIVKIVQRTLVGKWIPGSLERLKRECTKIQPKGAIFFTKLRKVIRFYKEFCKGCKILQKGVWAKARLGMHSR
jgi:hypothetical protein